MTLVRINMGRAARYAKDQYRKDITPQAQNALHRAKATAPTEQGDMARALRWRVKDRGFIFEVEIGIFSSRQAPSRWTGENRYYKKRGRPLQLADVLRFHESGTPAHRAAPRWVTKTHPVDKYGRTSFKFRTAGMSWRQGHRNGGRWIAKSYRKGIPKNDFLVRACQPIARRYHTRVIDFT